MLFSIYYKLDHRNEFMKKYLDKFFKTYQGESKDCEHTAERMTDLMELMANMVINKDKYGLYELLTKKNSKSARVFFNYLTCSNIRSINKEIIVERINEIFRG